MSLLNMLSGLAGGNAASSLLPILVKQLNEFPGGVAGLIATLQKGGLAEAVASWIGSGTNQPVTGEQLDAALPAQTVDAIAQESGQDRPAVLDALAQWLPRLIDLATPDGSAQTAQGFDAGKLLGMLGGLTGR